MKNLESYTRSPSAAQQILETSNALATGECWLVPERTNEFLVIEANYVDPVGLWATTVDAVETPFAQVYDAEEYTEPALKVLND